MRHTLLSCCLASVTFLVFPQFWICRVPGCSCSVEDSGVKAANVVAFWFKDRYDDVPSIESTESTCRPADANTSARPGPSNQNRPWLGDGRAGEGKSEKRKRNGRRAGAKKGLRQTVDSNVGTWHLGPSRGRSSSFLRHFSRRPFKDWNLFSNPHIGHSQASNTYVNVVTAVCFSTTLGNARAGCRATPKRRPSPPRRWARFYYGANPGVSGLLFARQISTCNLASTAAYFNSHREKNTPCSTFGLASNNRDYLDL